MEDTKYTMESAVNTYKQCELRFFKLLSPNSLCNISEGWIVMALHELEDIERALRNLNLSKDVDRSTMKIMSLIEIIDDCSGVISNTDPTSFMSIAATRDYLTRSLSISIR